MTFEEFWALYPRRVSKKDAQAAWGQMTEQQKFAAIHSLPVHVRYWSMSGTTKEFLPYPATWLRGERWEDELEMPEVSASAQNEWMKSQTGIAKKAQEVGITPKAGEGWHELKARILAKVA